MVVAGLKQKDFLDLLKFNGYEVLSSTYWDLEGVERIVIGKDGHTFAFRLKPYYFHNEVSKRCHMLGITQAPEEIQEEFADCIKATIQYLKYLKEEEEKSEASKSESINQENKRKEQ